MRSRKPSDYAHAYRAPAISHWAGADGTPVDAAHATQDPAEALDAAVPAPQEKPPMELATFRLLYESSKICVFETRDGHITAVDVNRLA